MAVVLALVLGIAYVVLVVLVVLAAARAGSGQHDRYPLTIRFVR